MEEIESIPESGELKSCQTCGRTFNLKSLDRHEKVCQKTKLRRRNVFNSFLQRAKETGAVPANIKDKQNEKCKKVTCKEEHENNINLAKAKSQAPKKSVPSCNGSTSKSFSSVGYIQCPVCNRYFSSKAADRHISWCQEQQSRMPKTPPNNEALERLKARIKYRAPLPGKKRSNESERLIKSADLFRGSSILRTHSSPPISGRNCSVLKSNASSEPSLLQRRKSLEKNSMNGCDKNYYVSELPQQKKTVKFKEKFPNYGEEKCDMLKALRLQLSKLNPSDNYLSENYLPSSNEHFLKNNTSYSFEKPIEAQQPWTNGEEVVCSTSSSSDGSLPSLSRVGSSERRLPRFCYNCGTKYPIVSAKFCCECGARRLIIETNNNIIIHNY